MSTLNTVRIPLKIPNVNVKLNLACVKPETHRPREFEK